MDFPIILPMILMSSLKCKLRPYHSLGGYTPKLTMPELMQHIHDVIKDTITPSWINAVPYNYSKAAARVMNGATWLQYSFLWH